MHVHCQQPEGTAYLIVRLGQIGAEPPMISRPLHGFGGSALGPGFQLRYVVPKAYGPKPKACQRLVESDAREHRERLAVDRGDTPSAVAV